MVWIPLANGDGQVVKGIKLKNPESGKTKTVAATSRKGINRYEITFDDGSKVFNHEVRKTKSRPGWEVVGGFHSPEELAKIYNRKKVDPDSNLPRPMRASFWKMKSKPGTHNYKQKKKLMQDPTYIKKFSQFFNDTLDEEITLIEHDRMNREERVAAHKRLKAKHASHGDERLEKMYANKIAADVKEETLEEGPKDAGGKDVFVKKIAKSAGVGYKAAGAIAAAAGRKRLGNAEFQRRVNAGQKAAAAARARGEKYKG